MTYTVLAVVYSSAVIAQSIPASDIPGEVAIQAHCVYEQNKELLNAYMDALIISNKEKLLKRSSADNFDLIIYVDTSYERRRTGGYTNNDSVISFLNGVIEGVQTMFNAAADNWDIIVEVDYQFFDGATPFAYGSNSSATLINFYDWLVMQGFPGAADNYVFYTGQYTNQGVSFVGALCFPAGALVGFVQSQIPNEDLASHEWIGHSCGSGHYNTEVNIMNSIASRPWLQASIDVIEDFLDNQNCVENVQGMMAISLSNFQLSINKNLVNLSWECNPEGAAIFVERFTIHEDVFRIPIKAVDNQFGTMSYSEPFPSNKDYYYRVVLENKSGELIKSELKLAKNTSKSHFRIENNIVRNPDGEDLSIFNLLSAKIIGFNSSQFDLNTIQQKGVLIVSNGIQNVFYISQ